jgi:hypothetical protein
MTRIDPHPILRTSTGDIIALARHAGAVQIGQSKDGPVMADYGAGAALLISPDNQVICGPVDLRGAESLALAVLARDPRALTQPQTALSLALALITLIHDPAAPQAAAQQEAA